MASASFTRTGCALRQPKEVIVNIQRSDAYIFSPTGTTRTIVEAVVQGLGAEETLLHDCTQADARDKVPLSPEGNVVILAAPVYYGRLPESMVPVLEQLKGAGKPVILIAVYGNREFDDALVELQDISTARGFVPVAAGAFIGEHSYATSDRPLALNRPDAIDLEAATGFGRRIREALAALSSPEASRALAVPGNRPYKEPENLHMLKKIKETVAFTPVTDTEKCTQCEICAEACPENAIDSCDVTDIDRWKCILCFACVKSCPEQAKSLPIPDFHKAIDQMAQANAQRKEPVTFMAGS